MAKGVDKAEEANEALLGIINNTYKWSSILSTVLIVLLVLIIIL